MLNAGVPPTRHYDPVRPPSTRGGPIIRQMLDTHASKLGAELNVIDRRRRSVFE
jgi:hypothetical protein